MIGTGYRKPQKKEAMTEKEKTIKDALNFDLDENQDTVLACRVIAEKLSYIKKSIVVKEMQKDPLSPEMGDKLQKTQDAFFQTVLDYIKKEEREILLEWLG